MKSVNLCVCQVMLPSLDDIQQSLNKACQMVLDVSKGVFQWGQDRHIIENFFATKKKPSTGKFLMRV